MSSITNLSPGVNVTERDETTSLPSVSVSGGAFAGNFSWGPVNERTIITDVRGLEETFSKPTTENHIDWFSCFNFLAYSSNLAVVRVVDADAKNASDATPQRIFNETSFRMVQSVGTPTAAFVAKYPGALGNSISVAFADAATFVGWEYADLFDTAPATSAYAETLGATNDEVHFVVIDRLGAFTGVPGSVLETYPYASKANDAKDANNGPAYFADVISQQSKYVWVLKAPTNATLPAIAAAGPGGGAVATMPVSVGGSGYANGAAVTIAGGGGSGFTGTAVVVDGVITAVAVDTPGTGYTAATVSITGAGTGFLGTCTVSGGGVTAVVVTNGGTGYSGTPTANIVGDGIDAVAGAVTVINGKLASVTIVNPGVAYTGAGTVSVAGGSGATLSYTASAILASVVDWGSNLINAGLPSHYAMTTTAPIVNMTGGANSTAITAAELIEGYNFYENADESDVGLILLGYGGGPTHNKLVAQHIIDNICEVRKDCLLFLSPNLADVQGKTQSQATAAVKAFRNALGRSTSYAVMDSGWKVQYDIYNNKYRMVPLNADIAGLCALVDETNDPWWSHAGYNRGRLKNVVSLLYSPSKTSRDGLYKDGINPVTTFSIDGTILMGDKTLQGKLSAFSFVGIRRLFIVLRKMVASAAKYTLFDFNTPYTRANFVNMVEPRLRDVQGRNGVSDFALKCDEVNNTAEVIQRGDFVASIFIKPMYSIQWVSLNFVAVRRNVAFSEIVGQAI